jgi:UDP-N-acetyl-D-glucosamine/UDP-N-acetyl-D-galactosamine dehydrogenase
MAQYAVKKIVQKMLINGIDLTNCTVGVLGITFKENCPDVRNSKIIDVVSELKNWGVNVVVVDPWVDPIVLKENDGIILGKVNCNNQVDSLIVAVGHEEFRNLSPADLKSFCVGENPVLADLKSLYNLDELNDIGFSVFRL